MASSDRNLVECNHKRGGCSCLAKAIDLAIRTQRDATIRTRSGDLIVRVKKCQGAGRVLFGIKEPGVRKSQGKRARTAR